MQVFPTSGVCVQQTKLMSIAITLLLLASPVDAEDFRKSLQKYYQEREKEKVEYAPHQDIVVYSVQAESLPVDHFYVLKGSNLYQVWKNTDNSWASAWALCTVQDHGEGTRFNITWEDGADEIGDFKDGAYTIRSHTADKKQIGRRHKMREASLPSAASPSLNKAIKRSIPLNTSKEDLRVANDYLDAAEQGFSVKTPRAVDSQGILHRMRRIRQQAELENAKLILDAFN